MSAQAARGNGIDDGATARAAAASLDAAEFAEYLRAERERRQLTLDQVADSTKIAPHHLAALERGDVKHWPGGMYRRAMMRAYAESIGVDREFALKQFERAFEVPAARPPEAPAAPAVPVAAREPAPRPVSSPASSPAPPRFVLPRLSLLALRRPSPRALVVGLAALLGVAIGVTSWRLASDAGAVPSSGAPTPVAAAATAETASPAIAPTTGRGPASLPAPMGTSTSAAASRPVASSAPQAAAPVPSRPAASEGNLVVTSEPAGARVTVNGIGWGETPVTIRHLALGDKRVRMTLQGYVSQERVVHLGPYAPDARLRLTLRERSATSSQR